MTSLVDSCEFELLIAQRSVLGRSWKLEHHSDTFGRIYFIEAGTGFAEHHGRRFSLKSGNIYVIPANTDLSFGCDGRIVIWWIHFNVLLRDGTDFFERVKCPYEIIAGNIGSVKEIFACLISQDTKNPIYDEFEKRACLLHLISMFLIHSESSIDTVPHDVMIRFRPVFNYIDMNLSKKPRVARMASLMNMRKESFSRLFSKCFGSSPLDYLQKKKIGMARKLLADTDRKLQDIAEEIGFTDAFHLSKAFKRLTGKSPKEFRESRQEIIP